MLKEQLRLICLRKEKFIKTTEGLYKLTISKYFEKYGLEYKRNFSTSRLSSIKAGGCAKYIVYPKSTDEAVLSIKLSKSLLGKYKIIGGCTNTFFSDEGFNGAIICTKKLNREEFCDFNVIAEAGASLTAVIKKAAENGIKLCNGLFGIPGTVGGAIRNNAGAYNSSVSDILVQGVFYDVALDKIKRLDKSDLLFSYRDSLLQREDLVFLSGVFKGEKSDKHSFAKEIKIITERRRFSQPTEPSLGSFFKRTENVIPAALIDRAGLKGIRKGGAEVSTKHAGFIINTGTATATDINTLANNIENAIFEKYGVILKREAEFVE